MVRPSESPDLISADGNLWSSINLGNISFNLICGIVLKLFVGYLEDRLKWIEVNAAV